MQFSSADGPLILGQSEEQKLAKLVEKLGTHLKLAHPAELRTVQLLAAEMAGLTILCQFNTGVDEGLKQKRTLSAAHIHQCVRRVLLDEDLEKQVHKLWARFTATEAYTGPGAYAEVLALLKQMRDGLNYSDVLEAAPEPTGVKG
jgi:hypothetical protein